MERRPRSGTTLIGEEKDYDGLPTNPGEPKKEVLKIAQAGAQKVGF